VLFETTKAATVACAHMVRLCEGMSVEKCEHLALFSQAIHEFEQATNDIIDDLYNYMFRFSNGFASVLGRAGRADAVI